MRADYEALQAAGLKLDLTRGKPGADQLDLSNGLLGLPSSYRDREGTDVRNYGGLDGLPQMREIFADLLGIDAAAVLCGGNSSLTLMHQALTWMLLKGGPDSPRPWSQEPVVKFVCPVPGYDRHFTMLAEFGIEMLPVPTNDDGPDVAAVRALVADDPAVKGIWIVPTYANPTGSVCSAEVAAELMAMPTAAADFRIFWDNAYAVHHLTEHETKSADALSLATASGHPNRPLMFASTSKITFAGAGVSALAGSAKNLAWFKQRLGFASIGPDKVNHLRHIEFFGDADGVRAHMRKHRDLIAPKFAAVESALSSRLTGLGIAEWTVPTGGYFVNLDVLDGTASRVVTLAREAGIALTPAGSAFPHSQDPHDRNIRLAPTFPVLAEVEAAMAGVAACVELAALESLSA
ncbi:MAG: aminotransferase class I/II-fold pyridoxal phosphate-dependent enzyme [Nocardioidaceae bacterium]|nr:aminotransferase class I/II-fold pyridoxal phosphate-dependent enzyme [Nocardioidaceae bacterium]